jgi:hypothetical protein
LAKDSLTGLHVGDRKNGPEIRNYLGDRRIAAALNGRLDEIAGLFRRLDVEGPS